MAQPPGDAARSPSPPAAVGAHRYATLPIPLLLAATLALWWTDPPGTFDPPGLQLGLNLALSLPVALWIAFLAGRGFAGHGAPGLLLLGCGALAWGLAGVLGSGLGQADVNLSVTVHNSLVWLSGLCHLAGVLVPPRRAAAPGRAPQLLALGYLGALTAVALTVLAAHAELLPTFFVQGSGGTPLRQAVLGWAMLMFLAAAALLLRGRPTPFRYWYGLGLALISTGLAGILLQSGYGSALGWTGRIAQLLGSAYLLVAALLAVREARLANTPPLLGLREATRDLEGLFELAGDGMLVQAPPGGDDPGRILYANAALCDLLDYPEQALSGLSPLDLVVPEERETVAAELRDAAEGPRRHEHTLLGRDGRRVPVEVNTRHYLQGGRRLALSVVRDVTERRRAEAMVRAAELFKAAVLDAVSAEVAVLDPQGRILAVNAPWRRFALVNSATPGVPAPGTGIGSDYLAVCRDARGPCAEGADAVYLGIRAVLTGELGRFEHEYPCHGPDRQRWFMLTATPLDGGGAVISHTDVTAPRLAEQALRERTDRYELVLAGAQDAIWDWDVPAHRVHFSPRWRALRGLDEQEVGDDERDWSRRIHPEDLPRVLAAVQAHFDGATEVFSEEYRILCKDGSVKWILDRGLARRDAAGRVVRMAGSESDITARKEAEQRLREADRRKDEFLAMLAHELRNPLAPIRNAAEIMSQVGLTDPRLVWVRDVIARQVGHLSHLVDDLLDVSRIVRGKIELKRTRLDLAALARQALDSAGPRLEARRQPLELRLPDGPVQVDGDPVRLTQVLVNLLDNAGKYSPEGSPVTLELEARGAEAVLRVRDRGAGIPAALLPRIFDLFEQGERTLDRGQGGLGIGLTMVKHLAEMHGGRVEATSPGPDQGAELTLYLPLAAPVPVAAAPAEAPPAAGPGLRVLVVDDDPDVGDTTGMLLEILGHQVQVARSGEEALEQAPAFRPRVVLLDIGLKGMDGYQTARGLRALPGGAGMYLVAVTGYGDPAARARSQAAGFDRHLVKPVGAQDLTAVLAGVEGERLGA